VRSNDQLEPAHSAAQSATRAHNSSALALQSHWLSRPLHALVRTGKHHYFIPLKLMTLSVATPRIAPESILTSVGSFGADCAAAVVQTTNPTSALRRLLTFDMSTPCLRVNRECGIPVHNAQCNGFPVSRSEPAWRLTISLNGLQPIQIARCARTIDPSRTARPLCSHGRSTRWLDVRVQPIGSAVGPCEGVRRTPRALRYPPDDALSSCSQDRHRGNCSLSSSWRGAPAEAQSHHRSWGTHSPKPLPRSLRRRCTRNYRYAPQETPAREAYYSSHRSV
jgi:hypothetical protein